MFWMLCIAIAVDFCVVIWIISRSQPPQPSGTRTITVVGCAGAINVLRNERQIADFEYFDPPLSSALDSCGPKDTATLLDLAVNAIHDESAWMLCKRIGKLSGSEQVVEHWFATHPSATVTQRVRIANCLLLVKQTPEGLQMLRKLAWDPNASVRARAYRSRNPSSALQAVYLERVKVEKDPNARLPLLQALKMAPRVFVGPWDVWDSLHDEVQQFHKKTGKWPTIVQQICPNGTFDFLKPGMNDTPASMTSIPARYVTLTLMSVSQYSARYHVVINSPDMQHDFQGDVYSEYNWSPGALPLIQAYQERHRMGAK